MDKKGFTLIELLAVILILGIIALIAVPQITNVIEQAREEANLRSLEGHIKNINNNLALNLFSKKSLKDSYYAFDELGFNNYPENDEIRCQTYQVSENSIISAKGCIINGKTYCFSNSKANNCGIDPTKLYASYNGKLHVCNTKICNQNNEIFRLTGASYGDFALDIDEREYSKKAFSTLKSWGANGYRIFINGLASWSGMLPYIEHEDEYINLVKTVIDNVIANDMYVIVDWNPNDTNGSPLTSNAIEALTRVANLYPNDSHIIYEIWNEPSASTSWSTIKEYANQVITEIRSISPDSIIIVGTPAADSNIDVVIGDTLSFSNIMYAHHTYTAGVTDGTLDKINRVIDAGIPIFETEWAATYTGTPLGNTIEEAHANSFAKLLAKYDISYMFFVFHATRYSYGFTLPGEWSEELPDSTLTLNAKFFKRILRNDYYYKSNLMVSNTGSNGKYYRSDEYKDKIVSIEFKNKLSIPKNIEVSWDLSYTGDNSIVGYLLPVEDNMYKLVIASNGTINAPIDSSFLFAGLTNLKTIDFTNFKTNETKYMQNMFIRDSKLESIDLKGFDVTKTIALESMFFGNTSLKNVDISTWKLPTNSNLRGMFSSCSSLEKVDMSNVNLVSTQNTTNIVSNVKTGAKFIVKDQDVANILLSENSNITIEYASSFKNDSWSTIVTNIRNGKGYLYAPNNLGRDEQSIKEVDLGELGVHKLRVANTNPCTNGETSETACGFVIEFADIIDNVAYNPGKNSNGGYPATSLYTYVTETVYNALPEEIKNIIINTTVVSGHNNKENATNIVSTNQKLYLLSAKEIFGDSEYTEIVDSAKDTTRQLDYYAINPNTNATRTKGTNTPVWWTRTASMSLSGNFASVATNNTNGYVSHNVNNAFGVSPAFRIG